MDKKPVTNLIEINENTRQQLLQMLTKLHKESLERQKLIPRINEVTAMILAGNYP
jgi:hypothetical protein